MIRSNKKTGKEEKNHRFKIKVTENGPYIVRGGVPLTAQIIVLDADGQCLEWRENRRYPEQPVYSLCRCGKSKIYPFCDGTHKEINFDGKETASGQTYFDQCHKFTGPTLVLTDVRALCSDAGFCDRAGGIWNLISHSDQPEARKIAIEEACNCPSGRLVVWNKEGKVIEPLLEPSIGLMVSPSGEYSGPIWVRGGIPIESSDGITYEIRNRITLCGCGRSANKPFCDGAHRQTKPQQPGL